MRGSLFSDKSIWQFDQGKIWEKWWSTRCRGIGTPLFSQDHLQMSHGQVTRRLGLWSVMVIHYHEWDSPIPGDGKTHMKMLGLSSPKLWSNKPCTCLPQLALPKRCLLLADLAANHTTWDFKGCWWRLMATHATLATNLKASCWCTKTLSGFHCSAGKFRSDQTICQICSKIMKENQASDGFWVAGSSIFIPPCWCSRVQGWPLTNIAGAKTLEDGW